MDTQEKEEQQGDYLDGQMLIAMPNIGDPRFEKTLIYMCAHSSEGAMGIVVNKAAHDITFPDLLDRLGVTTGSDEIVLSDKAKTMTVQVGGPVETGRGFVLHTCDYFSAESTLPIDEDVGLTATLDVLRAIASNAGPRHALLALGYAGWGPGQLETEIQSNGWLHCSADEALIFHPDLETKYEMALGRIGIDPGLLSTQAGHA